MDYKIYKNIYIYFADQQLYIVRLYVYILHIGYLQYVKNVIFKYNAMNQFLWNYGLGIIF